MKLEYRDYERILNIGIEMSTQKDRNKLLASILENGMKITHCDAGTLYLYENEHLSFRIMKTLSMGISRGENGEVIDDIPPVAMSDDNVCAYTALRREIVNIPDVYDSNRFDFSGPKRYDELTGYHTSSLLVIPIENHANELLGVLQLINAEDGKGNTIPFDEQYNIIIHSLASMAAVELTNLSYTEELKALLRSFVEAFATAVDERTPYNGTHTRKVAQYAGMLADYINEKHRMGECEEFFDADHREKLVLAALLHDIGKMIIPLSIMNRANRMDGQLETIEKRFELLAAFYEIDMLRGRITEEEYVTRCADLSEEMDFIRRMDLVGYLDDENYAHAKKLAKKKYIKADGTQIPYLSAREAECLEIRRGTLTEADRKQMENHVVMTEKILSKVHFNHNYKMIPKWAAAHHEFLDGTGYPRHLTQENIDFETRILTVADIYDALTAKDRPYKDPMPREQAMKIMRSMAAEGKLEMRLVNWLEEAFEEKEK